MSVLIKGMEMPTSCGDCKAFVCYKQWAGDMGDCFCGITKNDANAKEKNADCPLVPVADVRPVKWIPTTERLPEDGDNVIVCTKSGNVGEAKYQAALGYDLNYPEIWFLLNDYGNQYQTGEIIAWMPLPAPPKEET